MRGRKDKGVRRFAYYKRVARFARRAYRQWRSSCTSCETPPPAHIKTPGSRTDGFSFPTSAGTPYSHYMKQGKPVAGPPNPNGYSYIELNTVTKAVPPHRAAALNGKRIHQLPTHAKTAVSGAWIRTIHKRGRKGKRHRGDRWLAAAAFRVWCANGCHYWPKWDPDGRQPTHP